LTLDLSPECILAGMERLTGSMQIGEAAKQAALSVDAIRFYERRSLLPKAMRTEGRFRLYTSVDIVRLRFIRQMQSLGFSLTEIRQLLHLRERRLDACHEVRDFLKSKLDTIRSKIRELETLERELSVDLRKCNQELKHRANHAARACPVLNDATGTNGGKAC
jgi:DNA-binding transcriptional MerR regulator